MAWLQFEVESRDSSYREQIRFVGKTLTIGRTGECDISVGHSTVSSVHARIVRAGRKFRVEDVESRNGTLVNRIPVSAAPVHAGDVLTLGPGGPRVHLIEFSAGPAILPRVLLSLLALLLTAGGVLALRQEPVEEWLCQARLWLPEYEGAKWFAAEIPVGPPAKPPEEPIGPQQPEGGPIGQEAIPRPGDPRTRVVPPPPTHFGDDRNPAGYSPRRTPYGANTPLVNEQMTLPGPAEGSARDALAQAGQDPPSLAGGDPMLSPRYLFARIRSGALAGQVNETLGLAKAKIRASFPSLNILLVEIPRSSLAPGILRASGNFGLLLAATEGAPGGVDAKTQAAALAQLVESLDPLPTWADAATPGNRREAVINRFPPGTFIRSLDFHSARMAASGDRVVVVYDLVTLHGLEDPAGPPGVKREQTRALIFERKDGGLASPRDLPINLLPDDLRRIVDTVLHLSRGEDE